MADDEPLRLAFVRYKIVEDNTNTLWSNELRSFPNCLSIIPDDYNLGDLMEIEYVGKGPNINGKPQEVNKQA